MHSKLSNLHLECMWSLDVYVVEFTTHLFWNSTLNNFSIAPTTLSSSSLYRSLQNLFHCQDTHSIHLYQRLVSPGRHIVYVKGLHCHLWSSIFTCKCQEDIALDTTGPVKLCLKVTYNMASDCCGGHSDGLNMLSSTWNRGALLTWFEYDLEGHFPNLCHSVCLLPCPLPTIHFQLIGHSHWKPPFCDDQPHQVSSSHIKGWMSVYPQFRAISVSVLFLMLPLVQVDIPPGLHTKSQREPAKWGEWWWGHTTPFFVQGGRAVHGLAATPLHFPHAEAQVVWWGGIRGACACTLLYDPIVDLLFSVIT